MAAHDRPQVGWRCYAIDLDGPATYVYSCTV